MSLNILELFFPCTSRVSKTTSNIRRDEWNVLRMVDSSMLAKLCSCWTQFRRKDAVWICNAALLTVLKALKIEISSDSNILVVCAGKATTAKIQMPWQIVLLWETFAIAVSRKITQTIPFDLFLSKYSYKSSLPTVRNTLFPYYPGPSCTKPSSIHLVFYRPRC